jgi:argininosuccinate lyase
VPLHELPLKDMQAIEPKITREALDVLSVEASVKSRTAMAARRRRTCWRKPKAGSSGWKKSENWAEHGISLQFHA